MGILDGKVALITGGGQGVGQGIAFAMAKEGAAVAILGRIEARLVETCAAIDSFGGHAIYMVCDVSDGASIDASVARTIEQLGGIDILINNANDGGPGTILDTSPEEFQRRFDIGPMATFRFMKACYPSMKSRGGGSIINMASSAAKRWDGSDYGVYAAVKEAIRSLSRSAACEWGVDKIRVNIVAPHALSTSLKVWVDNRPEEAEAFFKTIPLGRIGDCEQDIGRAVVALVSDNMGYLTGATIPLDGGQAFWG